MMDLSRLRISTVAETDFVFELSGIGMTYYGIPVLSGVNLTICGGEIHTLIGENGAGKSTLVKIISGVITPSHGSMAIGATPVTFAPRARPRRRASSSCIRNFP